MPNSISPSGLTISTVTEIVANLTAALQAVYGADINVDSDSPDGQAINIFSQVIIDMLELLAYVYNSFDVDSASGVLLDQRIAMNGIPRIAGTFTFVNVVVTTDRALTLPGLDSAINDITGTGYTAADGSGNNFILAATATLSGAGAHTLAFRSQNLGRVDVLPNTITNPVSIVLGVTTLNNPTGVTTLGIDEETDSQFKARRALSFALQATGPADAVQAALLQVTGVTDAKVDENDSGTTVAGVAAHSIWCIVEGGDPIAIAQAIYAKKSGGCGMTGGVTQEITRPNGGTFTAKFDRPAYTNIYVKFTVSPKTVGVVIDQAYIKAALVAGLVYTLGEQEYSNNITNLLETIQPNCWYTGVLLSTNGTDWYEILTPADVQHKFLADVSRVAITV